MERAALGDIDKIGKSYASAQGHVDVCDSYGTGGHFFRKGAHRRLMYLGDSTAGTVNVGERLVW